MASRPVVVAIAAGLGMIAGFALAAMLRDEPLDLEPLSATPDPTPAPVPARRDPELATLREALAAEQDARIALAEELELIWEELAHARDEGTPKKPTRDAGKSNPKSARGETWFDEKALLGAGISNADAKRLRDRFEAAELDKLYLRDLATREGWVSTARFRNEMQQRREQFRADLGERDYDWTLFASGRNNRVLVEDVLHDSPAADAGLQAGDVIVRYDGELMLAPGDLRSATTRGRASETIAVDALRGSERLRVYVPRGPLGTRLGRTRRTPEE